MSEGNLVPSVPSTPTPLGDAAAPAPGPLATEPHATHDASDAQPVLDVSETDCCIVGGGPAGVMLALLLARRGVHVTLLETHRDFDRDFRGDTVHPATLDLLDRLGLAERVLQLPHGRLDRLDVTLDGRSLVLADFSHLRTSHPFIATIPQARLLEVLAAEAARHPTFRLLFGATAVELVEASGAVRGVRYQAEDGRHELRAPLTVAADGRFSRLRHLAGLELVSDAVPMDVLWFRLPRRPDEPAGASFRFGAGHLLILLDRGEAWQVGYIIHKGGYQELRAAGIDALRSGVAALDPQLADRVGAVRAWHDVALLSVESAHVRRWCRPGLLLIGDAAHVMSPVGGVGINYAIQDAVAAANRLTGPLLAGAAPLADLEAVQRRREIPTRLMQHIQGLIAAHVFGAGLSSSEAPGGLPPALLALARLPLTSRMAARLFGYGLWPVRLNEGPEGPVKQ